jgi:methionyl-tRNA formyltransferase
VQAISSGEYQTVPQPDGDSVRHAPKIFKETCEITWSRTSEEVRNFVRGLSPYPGAWTTVAGKTYKIFVVTVVDKIPGAAVPGEFSSDNKNYLYIKTTDGWISIDELQPEGKKRMSIQDFFRGNKL